MYCYYSTTIIVIVIAAMVATGAVGSGSDSLLLVSCFGFGIRGISGC